MKNAYAIQKKEMDKQRRNFGALIGQQFNVDMMILALNDAGFGYDRIRRILDAAAEYGAYYHECLAYSVESDARFEQLDERMKFICRDHMDAFVPWEKRYEGVAVPTMRKQFKAEPIGRKI